MPKITKKKSHRHNKALFEELDPEFALKKRRENKLSKKQKTVSPTSSDVELDVIDPENEIALNPINVKKKIAKATDEDAPDIGKRILSDLIMQKIEEKEMKQDPYYKEVPEGNQTYNVDEKVKLVFEKIGKLLKVYKTGTLPTPIRLLLNFNEWEQLLEITQYERWTQNAKKEICLHFAKSKNSNRFEKFIYSRLRPLILENVRKHKKLARHYYDALTNCLKNPAAFFKGFLFPILDNQQCTLHEAGIYSSILAKSKIPMLHSAAALIKICEFGINGSNTIIIRTLIDKKYALPYKVVDALVFYFYDKIHDEEKMFVLWYQCLLAFVQNYKEDMVPEQKNLLIKLVQTKFHENLSPEIEKLLINSKCRDEIQEEDVMMDSDME